LILGDEEAENQTVKLKWMVSKEQQAITQAELLAMTDELRQQINALSSPGSG
jgi:histidyl-tRNA synthetase